MLEKVKIGHFTDFQNATGCTVIVPPEGNIASGCAFGAAPGTRELALLQPEKKVESIHALVLTGGSAFGLNAAQGVMEELARQGKGFPTDYGPVPIVPAAVIFDKNVGNAHAFPGPEHGALALQNAQNNFEVMGNIGAGTGATVGKWAGLKFAMKAGIGISVNQFRSVKMLAVTVVNAVGDVLDKNGKILAGAIDSAHTFLAEKNNRARWQSPKVGLNQNTVLSAVLTNARLTKTQAHYLAQRVHLALARMIEPSHTSFDGDVSFVVSLPEVDVPIDLTAAMLGETVERSVINAVTSCESMFGHVGFKDLQRMP